MSPCWISVCLCLLSLVLLVLLLDSNYINKRVFRTDGCISNLSTLFQSGKNEERLSDISKRSAICLRLLWVSGVVGRRLTYTPLLPRCCHRARAHRCKAMKKYAQAFLAVPLVNYDFLDESLKMHVICKNDACGPLFGL